jgi:hypothetical protein
MTLDRLGDAPPSFSWATGMAPGLTEASSSSEGLDVFGSTEPPHVTDLPGTAEFGSGYDFGDGVHPITNTDAEVSTFYDPDGIAYVNGPHADGAYNYEI